MMSIIVIVLNRVKKKIRLKPIKQNLRSEVYHKTMQMVLSMIVISLNDERNKIYKYLLMLIIIMVYIWGWISISPIWVLQITLHVDLCVSIVKIVMKMV